MRLAKCVWAHRQKQGLYDPQFEHDACGLGFVVNMKGRKSHQLVSDALQILVNLDHRGAVGCEANTGDGAGILIQVPHDFFCDGSRAARFQTSGGRRLWRGQMFLPPNPAEREAIKNELAKIIAAEGQTLLGWRDVPVDNSSLGKTAVSAEPFMAQVFVGRNATLKDEAAFERKLYVIRQSRGADHPLRQQTCRWQMVLRFQFVGAHVDLQRHVDGPSRWKSITTICGIPP